MQSFDELKLSPALSQSIAKMGFTKPTPIQAETLPLLLEGPTDFLGMAATGTGKTAAFAIPLLERITPELRTTQAIVLCPTRELALQVAEQITLLGDHKKVHAHAVYGGTGYAEQIRSFRRGSYVIVATPGRLMDHIKQGNLLINDVTTVVFDEADEMISMGFKEDLEYLLQALSKQECSRWMFAATLSAELRKVADKYLRNPKRAQVNRTEMLSGTVEQHYYTIREKIKPKGVCKLIDSAESFYGLIFCQTKALVVELTQYLRDHGYKVDCLHGDKNQSERERTLEAFRSKQVHIVVCSDVAARGLDVKDITHVINYSIPHEFDSYVHRIGRTGRSGKAGVAISLVSPNQTWMIDRIEKLTKSKMHLKVLPSRKDLSAKKLAALLPQLSAIKDTKKALELMDASWTAALESMDKKEIVAKFLMLTQPGLFEDNEKAEEISLGNNDREERRRDDRSGPPRRREFRGARPVRFRGAGQSSEWQGDRRPPSRPPFKLRPKRVYTPERPSS